MANNTLQYTSRTYTTILNDINSDPALKDKPEWFKRLIAGIGDNLSMWENASANNSRLRTSFTRQAIKDQLQLIDYELTQQTTSSGIAIFFLKSTTVFPVSLLASEMTAISQGNVNVISKKYEARTNSTISATTKTFTHTNPDNYIVTTDINYTGHKVRLTTTGTLPSGLNVGTDYYLARLTSTNVALSTSLNNALNGVYIDLTTSGTGTGVHTLNFFSFEKTLYQQESKGKQIIGKSDGVSEFQIIDFLDNNVLLDTVEIEIASVNYSKVDSFVNSISTDTHWKPIVKNEGKTACMFGDGNYGKIPPANDIYATYSVGGGTDSNITILNKINIYAGGNSNIEGIFNATIFTGGTDEENTETAKILAPLLLKSTNRFITTGDGEALIYKYGGISLTKIFTNYYGALTCQVICVANGGGNIPSGTRSALQTYLIDKTVLSSIDVRVNAYTPKTVVVTSATKVKTGFLYSNISQYISLAWKMFTSETGKEIIDKYNSNGISETLTLINIIFSTSFTSIDNIPIMQIIESLEIIGYRDYGDTIQISDAYSYIQSSILGIDYITITLPSFPLVQNETEILTHTGSTYNLTEIL